MYLEKPLEKWHLIALTLIVLLAFIMIRIDGLYPMQVETFSATRKQLYFIDEEFSTTVPCIKTVVGYQF